MNSFHNCNLNKMTCNYFEYCQANIGFTEIIKRNTKCQIDRLNIKKSSYFYFAEISIA